MKGGSQKFPRIPSNPKQKGYTPENDSMAIAGKSLVFYIGNTFSNGGNFPASHVSFRRVIGGLDIHLSHQQQKKTISSS